MVPLSRPPRKSLPCAHLLLRPRHRLLAHRLRRTQEYLHGVQVAPLRASIASPAATEGLLLLLLRLLRLAVCHRAHGQGHALPLFPLGEPSRLRAVPVIGLLKVGLIAAHAALIPAAHACALQRCRRRQGAGSGRAWPEAGLITVLAGHLSLQVAKHLEATIEL